MIVSSDDCDVYNKPLTAWQQESLLASPECMRAFMFPQERLPPSSVNIDYLVLYYRNAFAGVMMIEKYSNQVQWHFMLLPWVKHKARIFVELCAIYCLQMQWHVHTVVSLKPELQYMHNFIQRLGMSSSPKKINTIAGHMQMYWLPSNWKPKYVKDAVIQF